MRSLSKPPKVKIQKQVNEPKAKQNKPSNKKIIKTVFHNPFRFKIQLLSLEDEERVIQLIIAHANAFRANQEMKFKKIKNQKFISFNSKVKCQKTPLVVPQFIFGVKQAIQYIKKDITKVKILIIFYQQNKHQMYEELMCQIIYNKIPYIITRSSQKLKKQLGINKLISLGIISQHIAGQLFEYSCRCLIDIPWLVNGQWIKLENNKS